MSVFFTRSLNADTGSIGLEAVSKSLLGNPVEALLLFSVAFVSDSENDLFCLSRSRIK